MSDKVVKIGIIGLGTVGKGVIKILNNIEDIIKLKTGGKIEVKKIVTRNISKPWQSFFPFKFDSSIISNNIDDILLDDEIDIVVELIGGYNPAKDYIIKALEGKKHVVTANKAALAKYWNEINNASRVNNCLIYFEASVLAGIPVIQGLNEGLSSNKIEKIYGILNGTTNYILTKMLLEKYSFQDALSLAQEKGFAEADPTFDIDGIDAAHKLLILASLAYQKSIDLKDVYIEGIKDIDLFDIKFAKENLGLVLKLLAVAKKKEDSLELRVSPVFISENHLLASVNNEYNAAFIIGDAAGDVMFYGKGAGELPAASGVVSDILYVAKNINNGIANKTNFVSLNETKINILNINEIETRYYIRLEVLDSVGALSSITSVMGKYNISIASFYQHNYNSNSKESIPVIITTHISKEKDVKNAIKEIKDLKFVLNKIIVIRIEENL